MKYINEWSGEDFQKQISLNLSKDFWFSRADIAGEGNMNFTYRVFSEDGSTIILKQFPPFCAKFPTIPAPSERFEFENSYFQTVNTDSVLSKFTPEIYTSDNERKIIYMGDLGQAKDFESLYSGEQISEADLNSLVEYLNRLHSLDVSNIEFENRKMRELNHAYIFVLPFDDEQDFNLNEITPGLQNIANKLRKDNELVSAARELGEIYFKNGESLLHGDFYPRSWIHTDKGLFIIDPEFAFKGPKEFDLSVFLAHFLLSSNFEKAKSSLEKNYESYNELDFSLLSKLTSIEVLRRLLFVAQVPVRNDLQFKERLIEMCGRVLKSGSFNDLKDL